jgi:single-stranded-DNA-specific exonuclease
VADVLALERELGVSHVMAQVLVRRGLGEPGAAKAWLEAADVHDPSGFAGIDDAVALILRHVAAGSRIVVHGDYDVDGVTSTAILVRVLRTLGAEPSWYLPGRLEDGYGLSRATVERLLARGTDLLVTADCGVTAVDEVAAARSGGMDVVVTDHHAPRVDGVLPDAPLVHPALCGYPCADLCAGGVAHKLAAALLAAAGRDPALADEDLDLVALATVADCVPLHGENRRLVRDGLAALRATAKPGLRALMRVAQCDPRTVDARGIGFRLAPRINAAGRVARADAALELVLTPDADRAIQIAQELDGLNAERKHVETRILFDAEAQVAALGEQPAYVLAGEGWHPGVIGIVASRIAERHHRPALLIALDGDTGTGSARSIPAYDLLAGLDACAPHLLRHGGHRAAAGCTVAREAVDALREALCAHAEAALAPEDLVPVERVDAIVSGEDLGTALAEELDTLAPLGIGNPGVSLLVPAARLVDARPMGEGKHIRFTVEAGGVRARAVAFGTAKLPPEAQDGALDATFTLELNEWNGAVEPRLVLRHAQPPAERPVEVLDPPLDPLDALDAVPDAPPGPVQALGAARGPSQSRVAVGLAGSVLLGAPAGIRDRRGLGVAGTIVSLVASGEPVLVACADATLRARHLQGRLGGFALVSHDALCADPALAAPYAHLVVLDPPDGAAAEAGVLAAGAGRTIHLAWGEAELRLAVHVLERRYGLRPALVELYRALRSGDADLDGVLAPYGPALAGRLLRVLVELGLVAVDRDTRRAIVLESQRTDLERSAAFQGSERRLREGVAWLTSASAKAA